MNFFKKLFGKSSKNASSDENVIAVQNIIPIVNYASEGDSLFGKLSATAQLAMLSGFQGMSKQTDQSVFNEIDEACKHSTNPEDLNTLALLYFNGVGVKQNINKGVEILQEAAEKGSAAAMDNIGNYYNSNWGGNDLDAAMQWWQKAAEKGFGPSQATLGRLFKERGDYAQARKWVDKGVAQGNADAEYLMGTFYTHGYGVDVDFDEAIKWYMKAAEKGHARAQSDVAVCYANGEGVKKDEKQMVYWYKKAAEQGDPAGLRGLYLCYKDGTGVPQDFDKAFEYLRRAAESGLDLMQHELGVYYFTNGDYKEAIKWYTKAAEQGFARSQNELGLKYLNGKGVTKDIKKAVYWFEKAAAQGHPSGMNSLGVIYSQKNNYEQAIYWWNKAADAGMVEAMSNLASCYMEGNGVEKNMIKGMSLLQAAADKGDDYSASILNQFSQGLGGDYRSFILSSAIENGELWFPTSSVIFPNNFDNPELLLKQCQKGDAIAQVFVGEAYIRGEYGFEQNSNSGIKWLEKAAKSGNRFAQTSLANVYLLQENFDAAIKLYRKAASQNSDSGLYNLAICYALGLGVTENIDEAMTWLNKAAEYGSMNAKKAIAILKGEEFEK